MTQSGDRTCRVYADQPLTRKQKNSNDTYFCHHVIHKREFTVEEGDGAKKKGASERDSPAGNSERDPAQAEAAHGAADEGAADQENKVPAQPASGTISSSGAPGSKRHFLFHDETLPTFFRRPSWSPDGSLLATPAGMFQKTSTSSVLNTTYVFSRSSLPKPLFQLPRHSRPTVAVRFCPVIFRKEASPAAEANSASVDPLGLPYKLVWAVATIDSIIFYDSSSAQAFAVVSALHMAAITDVAWASDASYVVISSHDGYCSTISFENDELGTPLPVDEYPAHLREALQKARTAERETAENAEATGLASAPMEPVLKRRKRKEEGEENGCEADATDALQQQQHEPEKELVDDAGLPKGMTDGVEGKKTGKEDTAAPTTAAKPQQPQPRRIQAIPVDPGSSVPASNLCN